MQQFYEYSQFMKQFFNERIQKISVNANFTCPNRDGSKGTGGCIFCNNNSFTPGYCLNNNDSISKQIENGIKFFAHKTEYKKFIVYFQSYSNTYGNFEQVKQLYLEALSFENVVGLSIGTRPDCVSDEMYDFLGELSSKYFILLEFGVESTHDETLLFINRGHNFKCCEEAILKAKSHNILTAAHLILGLPGETKQMMLESADKMAHLPIDLIKIHQLQIIKDTPLCDIYLKNKDCVHLFELDEYIDLCIDFIERLRPDICIERFVSQSPNDWRLEPNWQVKNYQFTDKISKAIKTRNTYQGRLYEADNFDK